MSQDENTFFSLSEIGQINTPRQISIFVLVTKPRKKNWVLNSQHKCNFTPTLPSPFADVSPSLQHSLITVWIYRNPHSWAAQRMFQFPSRNTDRLLLAHSNVFCKGKEKQSVGYQRFLRWPCRMPLNQWEHSSVSFTRTKFLPHHRQTDLSGLKC